MRKPTTDEIVRRAWRDGKVVPGYNIPYLPMMEPIVRALRDTNSFGLIMVARPEWIKFEAESVRAIREEYERVKDEAHTRLHLDHVPAVDEDDLRVDYEAVIAEALDLGYESVMVDGSRLPLEENIAASKQIADMAHAAGAPVEAELGAVMGHEAGPLPPYDEIFASGKGFTDPEQARRFVEETGVDWLSVAIGNIHGAISQAKRSEKKVEARLNIDHLKKIRDVANVPLVLHGGSGIQKRYMMKAFRNGIAKINVGTAVRQPYERARAESVEKGREAVFQTMLRIIREDLETEGLAEVVLRWVE